MLRDVRKLVENSYAPGIAHFPGCEAVHIECAAAYLLRQVDFLLDASQRERNSFPAEGVWLVENSKKGGSVQRRIAQIGVPPDPMPLAAFALHRDAIARAIQKVRPAMGEVVRIPAVCSCTVQLTYPSDMEVADQIIHELGEAMKDEGELF